MLLDLWEWFLLISDGVDLVFSNLAGGTASLPLSLIVLSVFFGLVSFFAWRSTDIPELPPVPRPPYVIQITAGPGTGGSRQTIADVRLLSGGSFFDGSEILSRYQNISRNQGTNTNQNQGQLNTSILTDQIRNASGRGITLDIPGTNVRRRVPGRSFFLGLFRRPNSFVRQLPTASNALRAQLNSPNVVVYHRVNVYHHHIHSHNGSGPESSGASFPGPPDNSHQTEDNGNLSRSHNQSQVPTAPSIQNNSGANSFLSADSSASNLEASQISETSTSQDGNEAITRRLGVGVQTVQGSENSNSVDTDVSCTTSSSSVQSQTTVENPSNPIASASASSTFSKMPERSIANAQDENLPGAISPPNNMGTDDFPTNSDDDVNFIIKFLNDTQIDVNSQLSEKIVDFKRRHFAREMSENKIVRLIFNGRVLDNDSKTLRDFGIFDQCVVHCLIVNRQQNQDQARSMHSGSAGRTNGVQEDFIQGNVRRVVGLPEPGMFFVAFIGIFLVFLWFICLHFGQHLFTQSAVVSLTVLTAIFLIGIVACYLPLPTN